jgi:hypothetical protein
MKVIPCSKRFVHGKTMSKPCRRTASKRFPHTRSYTTTCDVRLVKLNPSFFIDALLADWTICPFAHAGEKAVRRDPRTHEYTGIACPDMKKGSACIRGDVCPYAHNVFEYWLHPTRYRTQLCNDGPGCRRSICFFAHSLDELRVPACKPYVAPETLARASLEAIQNNPHPLGAQVDLHQPLQHHVPHQQHQRHQQHPHPHPQFGAHGAAAVDEALRQSAVLAALNAAAGASSGNAFSRPETGGAYTHISPRPPRLSTDYGSLPRWSNNSMAGGGFPNSARSSMDTFSSFMNIGNAGRRSIGDIRPQSRDASFQGSPPTYLPGVVRSSAPCAPTAMGAADTSTASAQPPSVLQQQRSSSPVSLGRSSSGELALQQRGANGSPGTSHVNDAFLAQSLATLKIALTQQKAASSSSTASNHEVVISTLHQLLRDAVAQQGCTAGSGDMSADTPVRLSVDTPLPDTPVSEPLATTHRVASLDAVSGAADPGQEGDSTYRLSQDLVNALL